MAAESGTDEDLVGSEYVCRELGVKARSTLLRWMSADPPILTPVRRISENGAYLWRRSDVAALKRLRVTPEEESSRPLADRGESADSGEVVGLPSGGADCLPP